MFSPSCGKANRVWRIIFQNTCLVLWLSSLKYNILFCRIHSPISKIKLKKDNPWSFPCQNAQHTV